MAKALPKQIQKQIDEADRIAAEIELEQNGGVAPELTVVNDSDTPVDHSLSMEAEPVLVAELDPSTLVDETVAPLAPAPEPDTFEHKYKTLQGMYNSEKRSNIDLLGRVDALENMLANLQNLKGSSVEIVETPAPADMGAAVESLLTPEEIADYGPDMIDVVKRAATEAVSGQLAELRAENLQLKEVVGNTAQSIELDARGKLYSTLTTSVPNWKQVNTHPDFNEWLAQPDVYSGVPRKQMLTRAFELNDAARVAHFFKGFLTENAALQPAANTEEPLVDPDIQPAAQPKVTLESLASPGLGASGGADNISETGQMWKESEIGKFYEDARKGLFKGRKEEYARIEQEIQAALSAGQILVGQ